MLYYYRLFVMSFKYSCTGFVTIEPVNEPALLGFSTNFIHSHKKYYLPTPASHPPCLTIIPLDADLWRTLTVWNLPDDDYSAQVAYKLFSNIGEVNRIERFYSHEYYGDDRPICVTFDTWNVNKFTSNFVDELTMCNTYNQHVMANCDKYFTTMFYDMDDGAGEQELYIELASCVEN